MKIRFTAPTKEMPFFTGVRVQTKAGWQKIVAYGDLGKYDALFPNQDEMILAAKRLARVGA